MIVSIRLFIVKICNCPFSMLPHKVLYNCYFFYFFVSYSILMRISYHFNKLIECFLHFLRYLYIPIMEIFSFLFSLNLQSHFIIQYILPYYNLSQMLQSTPIQNLTTQSSPFQAKMATNRSFLLDDIDIPLPQQNINNFKLHPILVKASQNIVFKQIARFFIYTLILLLIFSFTDKTPHSMIYSFISRDPNDNMISLTKQIPGLFPPLNSNWLTLLSKWNLTLINGKQGPENLKFQNYQLQFKHFGQQRQDVVYITKGNCKGHIMMNWQVHGSNIYLTTFQPPKQDSMQILNEPEDELCIRQNGHFFALLNKASIWTITEENHKNSLFLLLQQIDSNNQPDNYVLISQKSLKS